MTIPLAVHLLKMGFVLHIVNSADPHPAERFGVRPDRVPDINFQAFRKLRP